MSVQERVKAISRNDNLAIDQKGTTAKIELCGMCSLDCKFCAHHGMKERWERQKFMTSTDFEIALHWLRSCRPDVTEVGLFYMGESGLHPGLADAYRKLKEAGYFTFLTTNGTTIENILPAIPYIDSLKVSWNYKGIMDFQNKTNAHAFAFDRIVSNIKELYQACHDNGKKLAISTVLDDDKEKYEGWLAVLPHDEHYWIPLQTQGGTFNEGQDGVVGESESPVNPLPCWSLFKGVYVDVDLNVRTCCYGHGREHIMGNLHSNWNTIPAYNKEARQLQLDGKIPAMCQACLRQQ